VGAGLRHGDGGREDDPKLAVLAKSIAAALT